MKQNVKVFLIALLIGFGVSILINQKFDSSLITSALESKVTIFSIGSYTNIKLANAKKESYSNSLIYNDDGIYRVLIGVYKDKTSIDLMSSYFLDNDITFNKVELKVNNNLINALKNYELLIKTSDISYYDSINNSLLQIFNEYIN